MFTARVKGALTNELSKPTCYLSSCGWIQNMQLLVKYKEALLSVDPISLATSVADPYPFVLVG